MSTTGTVANGLGTGSAVGDAGPGPDEQRLRSGCVVSPGPFGCGPCSGGVHDDAAGLVVAGVAHLGGQASGG